MSNTESTTPADLTAGTFPDELRAFVVTRVAKGPRADVEAITESTNLLLSGLVDSLGVVMIVEWISKRAGVAVDAADVVLEHFESIDAMVAFLRR